MFFIIKENSIKNILDYISKLPTDGAFQVEVKKYVKDRSVQQNRLYWKWLGEISDFTGDTKDDLHDKFAAKLLGMEEKEIKYKDSNGVTRTELINRPISTKSLTTKQFAEYLEKIEITILTAFPEFRFTYPEDYSYIICKKGVE